MLRPLCAQMVAQREWVCTTPPMEGKFRYSSTWVGVSEEGFSSPSTLFPFKSITTISSGRSLSYSTPEGLMTNSPDFRSMPDTLPQVNTTSPWAGSCKLAFHTCSLSSSNISSFLLVFSIPYGFFPCFQGSSIVLTEAFSFSSISRTDEGTRCPVSSI